MRFKAYKFGVQYEEIDFNKAQEYKQKYLEEIDSSAFKEMAEKASQMEKPAHEYSQEEKETLRTGFVLLQSDIPVQLRLAKDGGIVNLYTRVDESLPEEPEAIIGLSRALITAAKNNTIGSHIEVHYYPNKEKLSIQTIATM
jgi:hypothetical protein